MTRKTSREREVKIDPESRKESGSHNKSTRELHMLENRRKG